MANLKADYIIKYEGKDITKDISPLLMSLSFTDCLEGKSGHLEIKLADHDKRFMGSWMPETNDRVEVWMGRENEPLLYAAKFWVDETEFNGSRSNGSQTTIRALSTPPANVIKGAIRSSSVGKSLKDFATKIANDMNLKLVGDISGNVRDNQDTSDLNFLQIQGKKNGYIVKVEDGKLVFNKYADLRNGNGFEIKADDVETWDIVTKAEGKYSRCNCLWYDAKTKKKYQGYSTLPIKGGGTATIWESVDSDNAAVERAKNWLEDRNKKEDKIELSIIGDVRVLAGVLITLSGFGKKDGKYIVSEAVHTIDRDNSYVTKITLQK